jgi:hypothetical protein
MDKPGKGDATAKQQADLEARTAGGGRGAYVQKAYVIMRCPGPPCTKGDHCWQDGTVHRRVQPHHIRMLADHLLAGKVLNGHDDVPDEFRRLVREDDRQWEERELRNREGSQGRKRRRRDSNDSLAGQTVIHGHQCPKSSPSTPKMGFPASPLMIPDLPREEGLRAYSIWQRSRVNTEEQKEHFKSAEALALKECLDLSILAHNPERMFHPASSMAYRRALRGIMLVTYGCTLKSAKEQTTWNNK